MDNSNSDNANFIGKKVCINGIKFGTIIYFGRSKSHNGFWCGVDLNQSHEETSSPTKSIHYFTSNNYDNIFITKSKASNYDVFFGDCSEIYVKSNDTDGKLLDTLHVHSFDDLREKYLFPVLCDDQNTDSTAIALNKTFTKNVKSSMTVSKTSDNSLNQKLFLEENFLIDKHAINDTGKHQCNKKKQLTFEEINSDSVISDAFSEEKKKTFEQVVNVAVPDMSCLQNNKTQTMITFDTTAESSLGILPEEYIENVSIFCDLERSSQTLHEKELDKLETPLNFSNVVNFKTFTHLDDGQVSFDSPSNPKNTSEQKTSQDSENVFFSSTPTEKSKSNIFSDTLCSPVLSVNISHSYDLHSSLNKVILDDIEILHNNELQLLNIVHEDNKSRLKAADILTSEKLKAHKLHDKTKLINNYDKDFKFCLNLDNSDKEIMKDNVLLFDVKDKELLNVTELKENEKLLSVARTEKNNMLLNVTRTEENYMFLNVTRTKDEKLFNISEKEENNMPLNVTRTQENDMFLNVIRTKDEKLFNISEKEENNMPLNITRTEENDMFLNVTRTKDEKLFNISEKEENNMPLNVTRTEENHINVEKTEVKNLLNVSRTRDKNKLNVTVCLTNAHSSDSSKQENSQLCLNNGHSVKFTRNTNIKNIKCSLESDQKLQFTSKIQQKKTISASSAAFIHDDKTTDLMHSEKKFVRRMSVQAPGKCSSQIKVFNKKQNSPKSYNEAKKFVTVASNKTSCKINPASHLNTTICLSKSSNDFKRLQNFRRSIHGFPHPKLNPIENKVEVESTNILSQKDAFIGKFKRHAILNPTNIRQQKDFEHSDKIPHAHFIHPSKIKPVPNKCGIPSSHKSISNLFSRNVISASNIVQKTKDGMSINKQDPKAFENKENRENNTKHVTADLRANIPPPGNKKTAFTGTSKSKIPFSGNFFSMNRKKEVVNTRPLVDISRENSLFPKNCNKTEIEYNPKNKNFTEKKVSFPLAFKPSRRSNIAPPKKYEIPSFARKA